MRLHKLVMTLLMAAVFGCGWQAGELRATDAKRENADQVQGLAIQAYDAGISAALKLPRWEHETELATQLCRSRALLTPGAAELSDAAGCAARSLEWAHRFDMAVKQSNAARGDVLARQEGRR